MRLLSRITHMTSPAALDLQARQPHAFESHAALSTGALSTTGPLTAIGAESNSQTYPLGRTGSPNQACNFSMFVQGDLGMISPCGTFGMIRPYGSVGSSPKQGVSLVTRKRICPVPDSNLF
jgi:hypothetical protein